MVYTFLTVLSTIWVTLYLLGTAASVWEFVQLTPSQQAKATVTVHPVGGVAFLLCVSWLITRLFT